MQPGGSSPRIASLLIVDDDEAIRESIRLVFEGAEYALLEARNGTEALARLREHPEPLVVILDLLMPHPDGEEVLRAVLRDRHLRRHHVFILLSARPHLSRSLRLQRMVSALAVEIIHKPFNIAELEEAVARAQTRQRSRKFLGLPFPAARHRSEPPESAE